MIVLALRCCCCRWCGNRYFCGAFWDRRRFYYCAGSLLRSFDFSTYPKKFACSSASGHRSRSSFQQQSVRTLAISAKQFSIREIFRHGQSQQWSVWAAVTIIAAFAPAAIFKLAFVLVAVAIALKLLFARDDWRLGESLPGRTAMAGYGFLVGLSSSLMGVSGGSVSNAILTLYGKSLHNAVAVSAGIGVPLSIAGAIGYALAGLPKQGLMPPFSVGYVSFIGVVLMAPISTVFAPVGAHLTHTLSKRPLEVSFAIFLLLVALRFIASVF